MAHFLDRIIFTALTSAAAFVAALNATQSLPAAILAGLIAPHPVRWLKHRLSRRILRSRFCLRRSSKHRAAQAVRQWSVLRDAACREQILELLKISYPDSADEMHFPDGESEGEIPVFAAMTLREMSEDAMADFLRRIRESGAERAVIVCTGPVAPEARALTQNETAARIAIIDGEMLAALLARRPEKIPEIAPQKTPKDRPRISRSRAKQLLPMAGLMLVAYFAMNAPAYLIASLILLWCALMLLKQRNTPDTLFGERMGARG